MFAGLSLLTIPLVTSLLLWLNPQTKKDRLAWWSCQCAFLLCSWNVFFIPGLKGAECFVLYGLWAALLFFPFRFQALLSTEFFFLFITSLFVLACTPLQLVAAVSTACLFIIFASKIQDARRLSAVTFSVTGLALYFALHEQLLPQFFFFQDIFQDGLENFFKISTWIIGTFFFLPCYPATSFWVPFFFSNTTYLKDAGIMALWLISCCLQQSPWALQPQDANFSLIIQLWVSTNFIKGLASPLHSWQTAHINFLYLTGGGMLPLIFSSSPWLTLAFLNTALLGYLLSVFGQQKNAKFFLLISEKRLFKVLFNILLGINCIIFSQNANHFNPSLSSPLAGLGIVLLFGQYIRFILQTNILYQRITPHKRTVFLEFFLILSVLVCISANIGVFFWIH